MINFVAIDPGRDSGLALFINNKYVTSYSVDVYNYDQLQEIRAVLEKQPLSGVVTEATSWARTNSKHKTPEYHLGGLVWALGLQHHKLIKYTPGEWRKVLGHYTQSKEESIDRVYELYDIKMKDHNRAEAICIGIAHVQKGLK